MFQVNLFFLIGRETLQIEQAALWSENNPTIDHSRFVLAKHGSWQGSTHQAAHDSATGWLRNPRCNLPEKIVKMVLEK